MPLDTLIQEAPGGPRLPGGSRQSLEADFAFAGLLAPQPVDAGAEPGPSLAPTRVMADDSQASPLAGLGLPGLDVSPAPTPSAAGHTVQGRVATAVAKPAATAAAASSAHSAVAPHTPGAASPAADAGQASAKVTGVTAPVQTTPVQTTPVQTTPVQTTPVQTTPVQTTPVQTTPVQTTLVQTALVQTAPVQTAQVQAAPVQAAPATTQSTLTLPATTQQALWGQTVSARTATSMAVTGATAAGLLPSASRELSAETGWPSLAPLSSAGPAIPAAVTLVPGALPSAPVVANAEQLAMQLQLQLRDGVQKATVRLHPEALGELQVSVETAEQQVRVVVAARQPEAVEWLQQSSSRLQAALDAAGFSDVDVDVRQDSGGEQPSDFQQTLDQGSQQGAADHNDKMSSPKAAAGPSNRGSDRPDGLDTWA